MKNSLYNLLAAIAVLFLVQTLSAYNITGSTLAELASKFNAGNSGWAGLTTWNTTPPSYDYKKGTSSCSNCSKKYVASFSVENCKIGVSITSEELPSWTDEGYAPCQKIKNEWDRFLKSLKIHEDGHVTRVNDFKKDKLQGYIDNMKKVTGTGCSDDSQEDADTQAKNSIKASMDIIRNDVIKALQDISDKYDQDTNHGATQGASLDTSITCQ
jgi:hypothetical protein